MNKKTGYEYYEDNGGGLHLFVFENGKVVDGITNLEYAGKGEWNDVKDDLSENAVSAVRTWEGHMKDNDIDAAKMYAEADMILSRVPLYISGQADICGIIITFGAW